VARIVEALLYQSGGWVAGSIPDGVIEIFHLFNPSARTMGLGSTQFPKEMNTKIISCCGGGGVKTGGA
jgi:hypothetical protein